MSGKARPADQLLACQRRNVAFAFAAACYFCEAAMLWLWGRVSRVQLAPNFRQRFCLPSISAHADAGRLIPKVWPRQFRQPKWPNSSRVRRTGESAVPRCETETAASKQLRRRGVAGERVRAARCPVPRTHVRARMNVVLSPLPPLGYKSPSFAHTLASPSSPACRVSGPRLTRL